MRIIHVLRKPCSEKTVAVNTLKHGTGGLNIDASRISTDDNLNGGAYAENPTERWDGAENWRYKRGDHGNVGEYQQPSGRWPANVILQHLDGCQCEGTKRVKGGSNNKGTPDGGASTGECYGDYGTRSLVHHADADGKETVANWICEPGCPVARLDEQSGERKTTWIAPSHKNNRDGDFMGALNHPGHQGYNDTGGASRFYKQVGGGKVSE